MKWILIGVICAVTIISNTNCIENEGLPLEIIPPERTLPDHLNEINKDDDENYGHYGHFGLFGHFDHFGIGNDGLEPPLDDHVIRDDDDDDIEDDVKYDVTENDKKGSFDEVKTDSNDEDNKKEDTDISQIDDIKEADRLDVRDDTGDDKKDEDSYVVKIKDGKEIEEKVEDKDENVDDTITTDNNGDEDEDSETPIFTTLNPEEYKFNPFISADEQENKEDQFRAIFLSRFLDPENLKILRERLKRAADDQAPTEVQNQTELKTIPLPDDDDDSAGRFLQT